MELACGTPMLPTAPRQGPPAPLPKHQKAAFLGALIAKQDQAKQGQAANNYAAAATLKLRQCQPAVTVAQRAQRAVAETGRLRRATDAVRQRLRSAPGQGLAALCAALEEEVSGARAALTLQAQAHEAALAAQAEQHTAALAAASQKACDNGKPDAHAELAAARAEAACAAQELATEKAAAQCRDTGAFNLACRVTQLEAALGQEALAALGSPRPAAPKPAADPAVWAPKSPRTSDPAVWVPLPPRKEGSARPVISLTAGAGVPPPAKAAAGPQGVGLNSGVPSPAAAASLQASPSQGCLAPGSLRRRPCNSSSSGSGSLGSLGEAKGRSITSSKTLAPAFHMTATAGSKGPAASFGSKAQAAGESALRQGLAMTDGGVSAAVRMRAAALDLEGAAPSGDGAINPLWAPALCAAAAWVDGAAEAAAQHCSSAAALLLGQIWAAA